MVRRTLLPLLLLLFIFIAGTGALAQSYVPGEVLVQLQPGTNASLFASLYGLTILDQSPYVPAYRMGVPPLVNINTLLGLLRLDPSVVAADPDLILNSAQTGVEQWTYVCDGGLTQYKNQKAVSLVDYGASALISTGAGVTVAVLDTGISCRPAFLAPQVISGWNFVNNNSDTDDRPYGIDSNGDGTADDAVGHGTMVAGTISRFAPQVWLMPVRVMDSDGTGILWNAIEGIYYANANGATVMNLSFGSDQSSAMLQQAINTAYANGVVIVASAGNGNTSASHYPADCQHVLAVAALKNNLAKANFSNYGSAIAVDTPGIGIVGPYWDGSWATWSGTSFAAPMVTAEAALLQSLRPGWSVDTVRQRILSTANSVNAQNPSYVNQLGAGIIDIYGALTD
ncbi:MAG TPA: S8 family serine peptidase [Chthonomonadaceae bacterium]|nr:S8 family serine peptidase [Chthonomonadaceae bacterium]